MVINFRNRRGNRFTATTMKYRHHRVFLNYVDVTRGVFYVDTRRGVVRRYVLAADGRSILVGGSELSTEELRGRVKTHRPKRAA